MISNSRISACTRSSKLTSTKQPKATLFYTIKTTKMKVEWVKKSENNINEGGMSKKSENNSIQSKV